MSFCVFIAFISLKLLKPKIAPGLSKCYAEKPVFCCLYRSRHSHHRPSVKAIVKEIRLCCELLKTGPRGMSLSLPRCWPRASRAAHPSLVAALLQAHILRHVSSSRPSLVHPPGFSTTWWTPDSGRKRGEGQHGCGSTTENSHPYSVSNQDTGSLPLHPSPESHSALDRTHHHLR